MFTPTGLPIELEAYGKTWHVGETEITSLRWVGNHTVEGVLNHTFQIPLDLTDGIFRPEIHFEYQAIPLDGDVPMTDFSFYQFPFAMLPPLTVGSPAPPNMTL